MDWLDYREKLGIGFNDEEKVNYFYRKMFNVLDEITDAHRNQISNNEYFTFCNETGCSTRRGDIYGDGYKLIMQILERQCSSLENFLSYYIAFINCQKDLSHKPYTKENYKNLLCNCLYESHIPFEVFTDKDGIFVFPKGVEEFDDALVSKPLNWLCKYPLAEKAWSKALRAYSESTPQNASDVADLFRKALETFFQELFGGSKSLENYKAEYGDHLKQSGIPKEIASNFETLLQGYTKYINNYAKHRDATSDKVLEYLMYQTGNIMRLLITLSQTGEGVSTP